MKKKQKCQSEACALTDLLGDVFITNVEPATKSRLQQANDEITNYRKEPVLPMNENPLAWWEKNGFQFPMLGRLAKRYLCVPATSVPAERVFSTAGDVVSSQRSALKPSHVDALIFLKKNY